jgi:hypothetical protein
MQRARLQELVALLSTQKQRRPKRKAEALHRCRCKQTPCSSVRCDCVQHGMGCVPGCGCEKSGKQCLNTEDLRASIRARRFVAASDQ